MLGPRTMKECADGRPQYVAPPSLNTDTELGLKHASGHNNRNADDRNTYDTSSPAGMSRDGSA